MSRRVVVVVRRPGSDAVDPGEAHQPADLVAAPVVAGASGGVPQLAHARQAAMQAVTSTSAFAV